MEFEAQKKSLSPK
uniref:Uncharacterized protein n=1 Tax=Rhizophora mucronata TaxID=61149 RepID=A0A2P2MWI1_RHIMU